MGLFGGSFEDKVQAAVKQVASQVRGVRNLAADIEGKVVTLKGVASTKAARIEAMKVFGELVKTESTVNGMTVDQPATPAPKPAPAAAAKPAAVPAAPVKPAPPAAAPAPKAAPAPAATAEKRHVVEKGDTLSAIAKRYYGKASLYPKIFEANRDILKDPDKIKVGQSLRIPE